jgi:integrase
VRTGNAPSRDRAILLLLVRLGLRCAEIIAMGMDDIDWQNGLVRVSISKSHRERVLPLPCDVGTALADYIQHDRPAQTGRAVFVGVNNPPSPLHDPTAITRMVKRNLVRAGIPLGRLSGAHMLRHIAASRWVNSGASLREVLIYSVTRSSRRLRFMPSLTSPRWRVCRCPASAAWQVRRLRASRWLADSRNDSRCMGLGQCTNNLWR